MTLLTPTQAARALNVSLRTVYNWIERGQLRVVIMPSGLQRIDAGTLVTNRQGQPVEVEPPQRPLRQPRPRPRKGDPLDAYWQAQGLMRRPITRMQARDILRAWREQPDGYWWVERRRDGTGRAGRPIQE